MKEIIKILTIYLVFFGFTQAYAQNDIAGLETGLVFPSPWSAVRGNGTAFGFENGEFLDATLGTIQDGNKTRGGMALSYFLSRSGAGFGVGTEYRTDKAGENTFINYLAGGIGNSFMQVGMNVGMNITSWTFTHDLSVRVGKKEGISVALNMADISSLTETFNLGIGYLMKNMIQIEIDAPIDTTTFLWRPRLEMFRPTLSLNVLSIKNVVFNIGISNFNFSQTGGGYGATHAGILYWLNNGFALHFTVNKRFVWSLGLTAAP